jgi:large subunit ribosomal protein L3
MVSGVWGKKIGMTQVFDGDKVVPVTAINIQHWVVTSIKTNERDGYDAVQVGCIKKRYCNQEVSADWLKKPKRFFSNLREVKLTAPIEGLALGQLFDFRTQLLSGDIVDAFGITKGAGFAGVVRRHGFGGGKASHGSTQGKAPGSMSGCRSKGKVIKGKKLAGHMGVTRVGMLGLKVVKVVEAPEAVILIKGSVPGKLGSLVFLRKKAS